MTKSWKMKDLLLLALLGLVFGSIYLGGIAVWGVATAAAGPIGLDMVYGIWFMGATCAMYIIRKPGIAFAGEIMAALGEVVLGTPMGVSMLLGASIQGAGCELAFLVTGYKKYNLWTLILSGCIAALFTFIYNYIYYNYSSYALPMLGIMLCVRLLSAALFSGVFSKIIGDGLVKTGALSSFAIGQA
ncbi:MAG: ECF transporter S component [Spirochaetales bacterium]|uniref:ECF transporter S component n=1 Tax=Candidatus Thalassospirochaeta sargassi TaxID=3119039 RepID=A0AAJ1MIU7_9SPIO|nr:ECF transporter S component [Spirochaetales bacterium]